MEKKTFIVFAFYGEISNCNCGQNYSIEPQYRLGLSDRIAIVSSILCFYFNMIFIRIVSMTIFFIIIIIIIILSLYDIFFSLFIICVCFYFIYYYYRPTFRNHSPAFPFLHLRHHYQLIFHHNHSFLKACNMNVHFIFENFFSARSAALIPPYSSLNPQKYDFFFQLDLNVVCGMSISSGTGVKFE